MSRPTQTWAAVAGLAYLVVDVSRHGPLSQAERHHFRPPNVNGPLPAQVSALSETPVLVGLTLAAALRSRAAGRSALRPVLMAAGAGATRALLARAVRP
jgi:hypothetical protein